MLGENPVIVQFEPEAPQIVECRIVCHVFKIFSEPFNLISDSHYVVNVVRHLEIAADISPKSPVASVLIELCSLIRQRTKPFYIEHIRAHTLLPGPMAEHNALADTAARTLALPVLTDPELAKQFHQLYHVPATTLRLKFKIPRHVAREIVTSCPSCVTFQHPPHTGVNPRGLRPGEMWQMDVTHISSFGRLQYVHVSVDTCSGIIHASPLSGEKTANILTHCLEAWAAWGKPRILKTDNGPGYTSKGFQAFCKQLQVTHVTGLPYNPQGQGVVERAHQSLKELIQKQKGGIAEGYSPKNKISIALFTLNFLIVNDKGQSAACRHVDPIQIKFPPVKWKDVLDNTWKGPDPVIARSRGAVCVFPQDQDNPVWVPERLTRVLCHEDLHNSAEPGDDPHNRHQEDDAVGSDQNLAHPDASAC